MNPNHIEQIVEAVKAEIIKEYGGMIVSIDEPNISGYFITGLVKSALATLVLKPEIERFDDPTYEQLIEFALIILDGVKDKSKLVPMVQMSRMIIDRLYEHGSIQKPSSKEVDDTLQDLPDKTEGG